jgi:hypothetical protein
LSKLFITGSCVIRDGKVFKDGMLRHEGHSLEQVYAAEEIQYPKFYKMDALSKLGFLAAEILLKNRPLKYPKEDIAIILSNANSSLDTDIRYQQSTKDIPSPALFVYTLPNIVIGEICIRNGFKGENSFFVFKAFDATFIKRYVESLMDQTPTQACICGWVEFLGAQYHAALWLVEYRASDTEFSIENLKKVYG